MKRTCLLLIFFCLAIFLTACSPNGLYRITLVTDGEHVLEQDLSGDLVVTGGSVTLPAGKKLDGSVHILSGRVTVGGQVTGDVTFLNGDLILEPRSSIGNDLHLGNGSYSGSPETVVAGRINTGSGVALPDLPERTAPHGLARLLRAIISGCLLGFLAAALTRRFPGAVQLVGEAARRHGLVSGAVGLLVGLVGISLLVTIAYTILLIPVTLLGLFGLGAAVLYGWISLGVMAGQFGARMLNWRLSPSLTAFLGTLAFMLVLELLSSIPTLGGIVGMGVAAVGLGAVSLTRFGLHRFVPASQPDLVE